MKKLYTSILAVACVFGASANDFKISTAATNQKLPSALTLKKVNATEAANVVVGQKMSTMADEENTVVGEYSIILAEIFLSSQSGELVKYPLFIEEGETAGTLVLNCAGLADNIDATYEEATGKITISAKKYGAMTFNTEKGEETYYVRFEPFTWSIEGEGDEAKPVWSYNNDDMVLTYNKEDNTISTPAYRGFRWALYPNSLYRTPERYLTGSSAVMSIGEAIDPFENYTLLGTGKFKDGVFGPMYGIPEANNPEVEVMVYENNELPGYYKVAAPWESLGLEVNLEFDATDPEYVQIPLTNTGFSDRDEGITYIVSQSYAFAYLMTNTVGKNDFIAQRGAYNITMDAAANKINMPGNACFFTWPKGSNPGSLYTTTAAYSGYLTLPTQAAIGEVGVDNSENAPVEYFNLQGMKVENPAAGQIVIRRQGSKVSKIFTK